jgi:ABC-type polysaccharide/polyol phosphate transport system ATPase subunit
MKAVELKGISKKYNIYERPLDRLKEILLRNSRCYHKEYWALNDIDVAFEKGKTTALLGPNGSGKSTLLQIIARVLQPTKGELIVNGRVTAILELGAGFQMEYTGRENVLLNGMILGISQEEMFTRMDSIAEFAEIGDFFDQPVKTYSSGMIVRLAFASAISVDPEILLVDEALAVGDYRFQLKCQAKIRQMIDEGKTILFVSHDKKTVKEFCHKAILMNAGRIIAGGEVDEILSKYDQLMNQSYSSQIFTEPSTMNRTHLVEYTK